MKYALPLVLLGTPALAHPGAHINPHGGEVWIALAFLLSFGIVAWVRR